MKLNPEKLSKRNICLIGLMGSGKSIIGKLLSKSADLQYFDSDKIIESKLNKSIKQIFADYGENYFRKIEEQSVLSLLNKKNCVISLGGGAILNSLTRIKLKKNSFSVYLMVDIRTLYDRLKNSKKRPLLYNVNIKKKLMFLKNEREKYYKEADLIIKNSKNPSDTVKKIMNYFEKNYE